MNAVYEGKISADCWKSPIYSAGAIEGTATPLKHTVPIVLTQDREHFMGSFFVDRLLSGKCGWHLQFIVAVISKDKLPDEPILVAQAFDPARSVEGPRFNSSDTPSFVHVKYVGGALGWMLAPRQNVKFLQGIVDQTHTIETNIIDDGD